MTLKLRKTWKLFHDILDKWKKGDKYEEGKKCNLGVQGSKSGLILTQ